MESCPFPLAFALRSLLPRWSAMALFAYLKLSWKTAQEVGNLGCPQETSEILLFIHRSYSQTRRNFHTNTAIQIHSFIRNCTCSLLIHLKHISKEKPDNHINFKYPLYYLKLQRKQSIKKAEGAIQLIPRECLRQGWQSWHPSWRDLTSLLSSTSWAASDLK